MLSQTDKVARSSGQRSQAVLDARCRVEMLGCLRLIRAERPETVTRFALQKAGALLAFLALHRLPQPRERILDLFWPEMDLSAARANLSTTLASLRRQIEPPGVSRGAVLTANHSQVGLNPAAISTDVADFESLLERAAASEKPQERAAFLQQAVDLYKGDLLPEFYYDWSVREMVRLQGRATEALRRLAGDWETLGELGAALQVAQRLAALDSASEESHARLIRLLARTGHPIEARDAYHKFVAFFEEEFGAPPSRETRQALESLLARSAEQTTLPVELLTEPVAVVEAPREAPAAPQTAPETAGPAVNAPPLPVILSPFFGREPELQQLARLLLPNKGIPNGPELPERPGRLVTLVGAGGNGKTRLALEFLRQAADRFEMWCGFVSLVDLTSADHLPETIAAALKIPLAPAQEVPPLDQVAAFLSGRSGPASPSAILALDNLEHLLPQEDAPGPVKTGEVAEVVRYLLGRAPGLSILCTSRQRLGLRGERRMPVGPLPVPEGEEADPEALLFLPSVRLYLDRAQAARPDFAITPRNAPAVAALCRRLEGSPLAIELAAAWVRMLPPRKMWERLEQGLDIPEGGYADLPARHRSLSAALEWSYRLLRPEAQRLFARLSVFSGGWTLATAAAVAGEEDEDETMRRLSALQEASLVTTLEGEEGGADEEEGEVRYRFLETVRVFARQRLAESDEEQVLLRRHADCFLAFAQTAELQLRGPEQARWLARLEADHDNLRAALDFYKAGNRPEDGECAPRLAGSLARFWKIHGYWREGRRRLQEILDSPAAQTCALALRVKLYNGAGALAQDQGDLKTARALFEQALPICRKMGDRMRAGATLHNIGFVALQQGAYDVAGRYYQESLEIARELNDSIGIADELHHLGLLAHNQGRLEEARAFYEESLAARRPLGDLRGLSFTLGNLANIALVQGDLDRAYALHEESLAIRRELGDRAGVGYSCQNLGTLAFKKGDNAGARALYAETLAINMEMGNLPELLSVLWGLSAIDHAEQKLFRAVQIYAAMETHRAANDIRLEEDPEPLLITLRAALDAQSFEQAWSAGQRMTLDEAAAFALAG